MKAARAKLIARGFSEREVERRLLRALAPKVITQIDGTAAHVPASIREEMASNDDAEPAMTM